MEFDAYNTATHRSLLISERKRHTLYFSKIGVIGRYSVQVCNRKKTN